MEIRSTANFYFVEKSFKELRDEAKLTLEEVAEISGYSKATIGALEVEGRGSNRLKEKLLEVYGAKKSFDIRENTTFYQTNNSEVELWKRRAKTAEQKLTELRSGLRSLLANSCANKTDSAAPIIHAALDSAINVADASIPGDEKGELRPAVVRYPNPRPSKS